MKIAIHKGDCCSSNFPNLALMKISAYHKSKGNTVDWFSPLDKYDEIFSSKVFTFTRKDPYLPESAIIGGTGYGSFDNLPDEIDSLSPDYTLYPDFDHALGFVTRGCIRNCSFCVVPKKEGNIRLDRNFADVLNNRSSAVLMDNNVLSYDDHERVLRDIITSGAKVDFNQGLDCRLVTNENARLLSQIKWIRYIRFACDSLDVYPFLEEAVNKLRHSGYKREIMSYVLVKGVDDALVIIEKLRSLNVYTFAQAFRTFGQLDDRTEEAKRLCRWCNRKALFNSCSFQEYK